MAAQWARLRGKQKTEVIALASVQSGGLQFITYHQEVYNLLVYAYKH